MLGSVEKAVNLKNEYEDILTKYTMELYERSDKSKIDTFCQLRGFDRKTIEDCGIFYVQDMTEMLLPNYFDTIEELGVISETNKKPIFRDRWVFPIKTPENKVQNLVGYSPYADERYIYGTSRYYRRRDTLYGLENLNLAYELGYAFVTEGITDTVRLRDMGFKNSFARCGTHPSAFMDKVLKRCRHGVIWIPDRDDPGLRAYKQWTSNRSATILINLQYKDIDEMCYIKNEDGTRNKNEENIEWFKEYANICVEWLKSENHNGLEGCHEVITMI